MGLFRRKTRTADRALVAELPEAPVAFLDPATLTWIGRPTANDPTGVPAVFRCIEILAGTVARFPIRSMRDGAQVTPTPALVDRPDPNLTRFQWLYEAGTELLYGNLLLWRRLVDETSNRPEVLTILPTREVRIDWNPKRTARVYEWRGQTLVEGRDVRHIPFYRRAGELLGLGPIGAARTVIEGQNLADAKSAELYRRGAVPPGKLRTPHILSPADAREHREAFNEAVGLNQTPVLWGGMDYDVTSLSARDLQWVEARGWGAADAARAFGVPFPFLQLPISGGTNLTYANVRDVRQDLVNLGCGTIMGRLEAALTDELPRGQQAVFDASEFLRLDPVQRAELHKVELAGAAWRDVDEVRAEEGYDVGMTSTSPPVPTVTEGADV